MLIVSPAAAIIYIIAIILTIVGFIHVALDVWASLNCAIISSYTVVLTFCCTGGEIR